MKKVLSIVLALVLIICIVPTAAFADNQTGDVQAKMVAARDHLYGEKATFTAAEGYDFSLYLQAGGDSAVYKDAYVQSVKEAFIGGTMTTADRVAIAMSNLKLLGVDTAAFDLGNGTQINLEEKMMENGTAVDSPYNYCYVLENATDATYTAQVMETLMAQYTPGSGYDYWGFATDNTANFGAIMAVYGTDSAVMSDVESIVQSAKTDKGYYYFADYGTDANGDSTASALYFFAFAGKKVLADTAFNLLTANFDLGGGAYCYELGGADNAYATRDALKALIAYNAFNQKLANDLHFTDIYNKMVQARNHLYGARESFTAADGLDFLYYLSADGDSAAYKDAYVQSVKDAFEAGSMTTADRIALAISNLKLLGVDTAAFTLNDGTTVNLADKMKEAGTAVDSPYNYRYVLSNTTDVLYSMQVLSALMEKYTAGSGYDYWGYSTDNTANYGATICGMNGSEDTVADCVNIVERAKTDKGYYYFADYGTDANGDSTASALYFYAAAGKQELADTAYDLLTANFDLGGGAYCYEPGGADNTYATRDALKALIEYRDYYASMGATVHVHSYEAVATAPGVYTLGYTTHICAGCGDIYQDTYTAPTGKVSGLKCKARTAAAEALIWNKAPSSISGYQIQISNAAGNQWATTKATTANSFVFKGLSAGGNYKFRVRFYIKAADGKYYFGAWSAIASPTLPAGTTLKLAPAAKAFVAKWGRKAVSGYQIQYGTKANFSGAKTVTVKNAKQYQYLVKNLKANTNYFVRIRTYKTIAKVNYFSAWSGRYTVKTRAK